MTSEQSRPFLSLIIPTYNRPDALTACLESVRRLHYPKDRFEVIVIDDASRTHPGTIVDRFDGDFRIQLLAQKHGGPAKARNRGVLDAKGDFLVFTDDDCILAPDFFDRLAYQFCLTPDAGLGGRTLNALTDNVFSCASQLHVDYMYSYFNSDADHARFLSSNNLAFPAESFRRIGGFNETFITGEDRELCTRWLSRGYQLRYCQDVHVYHAHQLTLRSFWSQHMNYGRGAFRYRRASARGKHKIELERKSFYVDLMRYRFRGEGETKAVAIRLLLAMSQLANTVGFLWESI